MCPAAPPPCHLARDRYVQLGLTRDQNTGPLGAAGDHPHRDPFQNRVRQATPFDPILVAGGGVEWDDPANPNDDGVA